MTYIISVQKSIIRINGHTSICTFGSWTPGHVWHTCGTYYRCAWQTQNTGASYISTLKDREDIWGVAINSQAVFSAGQDSAANCIVLLRYVVQRMIVLPVRERVSGVSAATHTTQTIFGDHRHYLPWYQSAVKWSGVEDTIVMTMTQWSDIDGSVGSGKLEVGPSSLI